MSAEHDSIAASAWHSAGLVAAWIGTISVADVQPWVAVFSGLALLVYTVARTYFLIKNRGEK